jgi:hypothetical protein
MHVSGRNWKLMRADEARPCTPMRKKCHDKEKTAACVIEPREDEWRVQMESANGEREWRARMESAE